jgi:hypothetical protein
MKTILAISLLCFLMPGTPPIYTRKQGESATDFVKRNFFQQGEFVRANYHTILEFNFGITTKGKKILYFKDGYGFLLFPQGGSGYISSEFMRLDGGAACEKTKVLSVFTMDVTNDGKKELFILCGNDCSKYNVKYNSYDPYQEYYTEVYGQGEEKKAEEKKEPSKGAWVYAIVMPCDECVNRIYSVNGKDLETELGGLQTAAEVKSKMKLILQNKK